MNDPSPIRPVLSYGTIKPVSRLHQAINWILIVIAIVLLLVIAVLVISAFID